MAQSKDTLGFKANKDYKRRVDQYKQERGHDRRSDALKELVEVGLRERKSPMLARFKDELVRWAGFLCVIAVVTFGAGLFTRVIRLYDAAVLALVCLFVAVWLLAILEVARWLNGQSMLNWRGEAE